MAEGQQFFGNGSPAPSTRIGDWSQTATGKMFWPMDPRPEEVCIKDIAHALSMQCRFGGHCLKFYSVAEHCVHMARAVSQQNALWALLHDASEAYIVDVPRPIKKYLAGYSSIEQRIMFAVCDKFGLPRTMPREVKQADDAILLAEADQIMGPKPAPWNIPGPAMCVRLECWVPVEARRRFLETFDHLSLLA